MIKMESPVTQIARVRRALSPDFAMSNNSTPATDQMKKSTSISEEDWKTPRKEGYPDQSPRSSARKWLKSGEALLTVMSSSTQGGLLASISTMFEDKDELLSIIERFPNLTDIGPAAVREKSSAVEYVGEDLVAKLAYRIEIGDSGPDHVFKMMSYLLVGHSKLWRTIRLFFVYKVLSTDSIVTLTDPEDEARFLKMDFSIVALEHMNQYADTVSEYLTLIVKGEVTEARAGILELAALCEWFGLAVGLWDGARASWS